MYSLLLFFFISNYKVNNPYLCPQIGILHLERIRQYFIVNKWMQLGLFDPRVQCCDSGRPESGFGIPAASQNTWPQGLHVLLDVGTHSGGKGGADV